MTVCQLVVAVCQAHAGCQESWWSLPRRRNSPGAPTTEMHFSSILSNGLTQAERLCPLPSSAFRRSVALSGIVYQTMPSIFFSPVIFHLSGRPRSPRLLMMIFRQIKQHRKVHCAMMNFSFPLFLRLRQII